MKNWVPRWDSKLVAVNNRAQQLPYHNTLNLPVSLWTPLTIHACKALMAPPPSKTCPPQSSSSSRTSRRVVYSTIIQIITSTSDKFARWVETHSRWDSHDIPPRKFTSRLSVSNLWKGPKHLKYSNSHSWGGRERAKLYWQNCSVAVTTESAVTMIVFVSVGVCTIAWWISRRMVGHVFQ